MRFDAQRVAVAVFGASLTAVLLAGCGPTAPVGPAAPAAPAGAGAGGGPAAPASAAAGAGAAIPNPCSLVTEDEATTAIGQPAGAGVAGGTADAPQCLFGNGILIIVATNTGKADYDQNHAAMAGGPSGSSQDVSGIGEGAFEVSGGATALVYFYKGTTLVEVMLGGRLTAPADAAITVARAAANRA